MSLEEAIRQQMVFPFTYEITLKTDFMLTYSLTMTEDVKFKDVTLKAGTKLDCNLELYWREEGPGFIWAIHWLRNKNTRECLENKAFHHELLEYGHRCILADPDDPAPAIQMAISRMLEHAHLMLGEEGYTYGTYGAADHFNSLGVYYDWQGSEDGTGNEGNNQEV